MRPWKLLKSWQGRLQVILQVSVPDHEGKGWRKAYLYLSGDAPKANVTLSFAKTGQTEGQGSVVGLLRKLIPTGLLSEIFKHNDWHEYWVKLERMEEGEARVYWVHLNSKPHPEVSFVDQRERASLFRVGTKGVFTKRKAWEGPLPGESEFAQELFGSVGEELLASALAAEPAPAEGAGDSGPEGSPPEAFEDVRTTFQRESRSRLFRRLRTVRKAYTQQQRGVASEDAVKLLKKQAELLRSYSYLVKPDALELVLDEAQTGGEMMVITLNPDKSTGQNIEDYFSRLKKSQRNLSINVERLKTVAANIHAMEEDLERLTKFVLSESEITAILRRHKLAQDKPKLAEHRTKEDHVPYHVFRGKRGTEYYVGKNPADNDELTKGARSNDFWVHTTQTSGSHVIIPFRFLTQGGMSEVIKREAAMLAVHFSKLRLERAGEVYVTRKANLRKKKGLAPGLWLVEKSDTYFVRYEEAELREILGNL